MSKVFAKLLVVAGFLGLFAGPLSAQVLDLKDKKKDDMFHYSDKEKSKSEVASKKKTGDNSKSEKKKEKKKKLSEEEIQERISKNEEATLKKYRDILNSEKYEVKNLKARIKTNERLVDKYEKKLKTTKDELKVARVERVRRSILLRKSLEDGRINKKEFDKQFKRINERYKIQISELEADKEFYERELGRAKSRLSDLKSELKVKEEARRVAEDYGKKKGKNGKFSNKEFNKIYRKFKSLLPKKLKPVYRNDPFESPIMQE